MKKAKITGYKTFDAYDIFDIYGVFEVTLKAFKGNKFMGIVKDSKLLL